MFAVRLLGARSLFLDSLLFDVFHEPIDNILALLITYARGAPKPKLVQIIHLELVDKLVKYNIF